MTFNTVRTVGLALPDVEATTKYDGSPVLKMGGSFMAGLATHRSAEPETLVVRIGLEERAWLIEDAPEVYYLTDYYRGHPVVLVRLSRIDRDALRDLLSVSWRLTAAKAGNRHRTRRHDRAAARKEAFMSNETVEEKLFDAARKGDVDTLGGLLDQYPDRLHARAKPYEWSLLHLAAQSGHLPAVVVLLARGLSANTREKGDYTCPLHWAAAAAHLHVVRRLADAGGDVVGHGDDHELDVIGRATWQHVQRARRDPGGGTTAQPRRR